MGKLFRNLAEQKVSRIEVGQLTPDHVRMVISTPLMCAVSQVVAYVKGKSEIRLARVYGEHKRYFVGQSSWARGHFVSTAGRSGDLAVHV